LKQVTKLKALQLLESKLDVLQSHKIEPFLIRLEENQIIGTISEFLTDSEILIIDIPPGLRKITEATSEKRL